MATPIPPAPDAPRRLFLALLFAPVLVAWLAPIEHRPRSEQATTLQREASVQPLAFNFAQLSAEREEEIVPFTLEPGRRIDFAAELGSIAAGLAR